MSEGRNDWSDAPAPEDAPPSERVEAFLESADEEAPRTSSVARLTRAGLGIGLVLVGTLVLIAQADEEAWCHDKLAGIELEAKVVGIDERVGKKPRLDRYTMTYVHRGHEFTGTVKHTVRGAPTVEVGHTLAILFDPLRPKEPVIKERVLHRCEKEETAVGLPLVAAGVLVLVSFLVL